MRAVRPLKDTFTLLAPNPSEPEPGNSEKHLTEREGVPALLLQIECDRIAVNSGKDLNGVFMNNLTIGQQVKGLILPQTGEVSTLPLVLGCLGAAVLLFVIMLILKAKNKD